MNGRALRSCAVRETPSFKRLAPASARASRTARASSKKANTRCEVILRKELWRRGMRYKLHSADLPGRPDIVFVRRRLVVFCDGDFWHGRNLSQRLTKLSKGHNAAYWVRKVQANVARDVRNADALAALGWRVIRLWETDILRDPTAAADAVAAALLDAS